MTLTDDLCLVLTEFLQQNWVYPNPKWTKMNPNLNVTLKGYPR